MRKPCSSVRIALPLAAALPLALGPLGATAAAAAEVRGDGPLHYESHLLELPGDVVLTFYEDIDGDGLHDVLAVHESRPGEEEEPPRHLVVYFQRQAGFLSGPDLLEAVLEDL